MNLNTPIAKSDIYLENRGRCAVSGTDGVFTYRFLGLGKHALFYLFFFSTKIREKKMGKQWYIFFM